MTSHLTLPAVPGTGVRICFVGKGGSAKTTTAAHMLKRWSDQGFAVAGIDTDEPGEDEDGSLSAWDSIAPIGAANIVAHRDPMTLANMAVGCTPKGGILGIDTDAWRARIGGAHMAALAVSHLAVLMIQPTGMELQRAASVRSSFQSMTDMGMRVPPLVVILSRTNASAASPKESAGVLREAGYNVLQTMLPNSDGRDGYGQSFGKPITIGEGEPMALAADLVLAEAVRGN